MTTQRERFEAFASTDTFGLTPAELEIGWHFWQEAERQMIERFAMVFKQAIHRADDMGAILERRIRALGDDDES